MKYLASIFIIALMCFSCEKEEIVENEDITSNTTFITTPGSYWIYDVVAIDVNNNTTDTGIRDTITVLGDTIINGSTYTNYYGTFMGGPHKSSYLKDSSGYIVSSTGAILYSYMYFNDTISESSMNGYDTYTYSVDESNTVFSVPAGSFNSAVRQTDYYKTDGSPIDTCGNMVFSLKNRYAPEVGLIFQNCPYFSEMQNCGDRERRLIEYNIQ